MGYILEEHFVTLSGCCTNDFEEWGASEVDGALGNVVAQTESKPKKIVLSSKCQVLSLNAISDGWVKRPIFHTALG